MFFKLFANAQADCRSVAILKTNLSNLKHRLYEK